MLRSTGYFRGIDCPFLNAGGPGGGPPCRRPYCHFRHPPVAAAAAAAARCGVSGGHGAVECRSAALVLEKWKAQFASPGIPKPLSPGWARWFRGAGMALSAHVIPARRQRWAVGRQRQAAPGCLPALPAPSVGCGAGKGELPWAPGTGRPLRVTLRITHRLGNHCARQFGRSNQVKSDVYSWGKYNVKKIPQGDGSSARKEETRQKAPADTRVKRSLTWE